MPGFGWNVQALGTDLPKLLSDFPQTQAVVPTILQNPFEFMDSGGDGVQYKPSPEELWKWGEESPMFLSRHIV